MDVKKISALITIIDCGSLSAAAEKLDYTQSGLTHMMKNLETEIGFQILERGHYGVKINENGKRLLPYFREITKNGDELSKEIKNILSGDSSIIKIGAYTSIALHWIPPVVQQFQKNYPTAKIEIKTGSVDEIYGWLSSGEIELAFVSRQEGRNVKWIGLREDPLVAILPAGFDTRGKAAFPIEWFNNKKFLMPSFGFDTDILAALAKRDVRPQIQSFSLDDPSIIAMVERGIGLSTLSELVVEGRNDNVKILPLEPNSSRQLGIALNKKASVNPATKRFISFSKAVIAKHYKIKD